MGSSYTRHVGALLRRNFLYRKRSWLATLIQLALPATMIGILIAIKNSLKDDEFFKPTLEPAVIPQDSVSPLTFHDYIEAIKLERRCVFMPFDIRTQDLGFTFQLRSISDLDPGNWPVPFLTCNFRNCKSFGQPADDLCEVKVLAIAPTDNGENERVEAFEEYIRNMYPDVDNLDTNYSLIKRFDNSGALDDYVRDPEYGDIDKDKPKIAVAVVIGGTEKEYKYAIRVNSTNVNSPEFGGRWGVPTTPDTSRVLRSTARRAKDSCPLLGGTSRITDGVHEEHCIYQYIYNGALTIQRLVDDFILDDTKGTKIAENGVSFADFPSEPYTTDGFYEQISQYVPLLLVLGLLYPVSAVYKSIVLEKERKQKELMKMMSISESAIELSWFLSWFSVFFFSALFCTISCSTLYPTSSPAILFIFWEIGFIAIVVFAMAFSTVFFKSVKATLYGILVFFAGYFITFAAEYDIGNGGTIRLLCLHPVACLTYGLQIIGLYEDANLGVTRSTFNVTDNPSGLTFGGCIGSFIFDSIFWGLVMAYLNRTVKGDLGQSLPWYFPFQISYWCRNNDNTTTLDPNWEDSQGVPIEKVGAALKEQETNGEGVHIRGLRKEFGDKTAVDGLDLSMYNGQIFSLLGSNGAGKTTTISMLTGMLAPTEGYAVINGKNINSQMDAIREDLGICLQHDCLFPELTVLEHIRFFSRIKGLYQKETFEDAERSAETALRDVALFEKRNTYSKDLSGGMKRKLSLAIAFCGGSKIVFLDEPTSGMDTFSRRFIWEVIRENRQNRCIILTTHFMDEADLLGDRIAIMAEGRLRCLGSSLFLKKTFGVGYHITIEKSSENPELSRGAADIVESSVEAASLLSNAGTELSYRLPLNSSDKFPSMFDALDMEVDKKSIVNYGIGITTLEEVFLLIARGETTERHTLASSLRLSKTENAAITSNSYRSQDSMPAQSMFFSHVQSLLRKRAYNFKRDKKSWIFSTIVPILFSLLGFFLVKFAVPDFNMKNLDLDLSSLLGSQEDTPFPINNGNTFSCQPAQCAANPDFYTSNVFCGLTNFSSASSRATCSSTAVNMEASLESSNLSPVDMIVQNITAASQQLRQNPSDLSLQENQYGALYYTHTDFSIIQESGVFFENFTEQICASTNGVKLPCDRFKGLGYVVSTNYTAPHASLLFQALADQSIIRHSTGDFDYTIKPSIFPLPLTHFETKLVENSSAFSAWFFLILSFPFILGQFGSFIVQERESKAKHLQTVAGVKPGAYWLSTYIWDVINYQFALWSVVIMLYGFGIGAFTTSKDDVNSATILTLILYGPASAGFTYLTTFLFKSPSSCNTFTIVFNFFVGLAGALVVLILKSIHFIQEFNGSEGNLMTIALCVEWILRFIPSFNFAKGLLFVINIQVFEIFRGTTNAWGWNIMGVEIIFLAIQSFLYLILAIYVDIWSTNPSIARICSRKVVSTEALDSNEENVDEDVLAETLRVQNGEANGDTIVIDDIKKQYPNGKVAVRGISLGIPGGQCFGLLGINGAGKTSLMACLTAEFPPTSGDATLAGFSVTTQPEETRKRIGYCPQFDAHFPNLTGREHVELYATIRGIPKDHVATASASKLAEVGLSESDSDKLSSSYSGGMRRKLSVAIATVGNPEILFLDEPSTGMDPVSRRDLWEVISNMVVGDEHRDWKTSVILTTHSMEECEALCPRICIMAGGRMKCLGSAQHLKNRFGKGYQVELKVKQPVQSDSDLENVISLLTSSHPDSSSNADTESGIHRDLFFNLDQTLVALQSVSNDDYLSSKVNLDDPSGYFVYKNATSDVGIELKELTAFCVLEMRLRAVETFFKESYPGSILREVQDTRLRYEVSSEGTKISSLFMSIEEKKEALNLQDYGISQTTLEQVFNMHAAAEEELKQGANYEVQSGGILGCLRGA